MTHTFLVLFAGLSSGLLFFGFLFLWAVFLGMLCSYHQRHHEYVSEGD